MWYIPSLENNNAHSCTIFAHKFLYFVTASKGQGPKNWMALNVTLSEPCGLRKLFSNKWHTTRKLLHTVANVQCSPSLSRKLCQNKLQATSITRPLFHNKTFHLQHLFSKLSSSCTFLNLCIHYQVFLFHTRLLTSLSTCGCWQQTKLCDTCKVAW